MKKITGLLIASVFVGAVLSSCGDKYVPLTEEQKTAKADSIFTATSEAYKAEKEAACAAEMQAKVEAKVQELTAAAATATN
ncbi:MAG: hypothetical protein JNL95_06035 [Chitinophagales bacterium]|jgi:hypothetical protein|nr:hypothetical protein [Chitinophagales bacterium]MBP6515415.1 hypothetical protein [Chitinophagales bacterium]